VGTGLREESFISRNPNFPTNIFRQNHPYPLEEGLVLERALVH
jgi:hypothetical protein